METETEDTVIGKAVRRVDAQAAKSGPASGMPPT